MINIEPSWNYVSVFGSGWTTNPVSNARYIKNRDNLITISGAANGNSYSNAIFNLPAGFRPSKLECFPCVTVNGSSGGSQTIYGVEVRTNGDVIVAFLSSYPIYASDSPTYLSSISFYAI